MRRSGKNVKRAIASQQESTSLAGSLRLVSHFLISFGNTFYFQFLGSGILLLLNHLPLPLRYQLSRVTTLVAPPLFYIIAAEKDRLKSLSKIGTIFNEGGLQPNLNLCMKRFLCSSSATEGGYVVAEAGGAGAEGGGAGAEGGGDGSEGGGDGSEG